MQIKIFVERFLIEVYCFMPLKWLLEMTLMYCTPTWMKVIIKDDNTLEQSVIVKVLPIKFFLFQFQNIHLVYSTSLTFNGSPRPVSSHLIHMSDQHSAVMVCTSSRGWLSRSRPSWEWQWPGMWGGEWFEEALHGDVSGWQGVSGAGTLPVHMRTTGCVQHPQPKHWLHFPTMCW